MSATLSEPAPYTTPLVDRNGFMQQQWQTFYSVSFFPRLEQTSAGIASQSFTGQSAALGVTTLGTAQSTGLYRVNYWARVTTPAGVSSSLIVNALNTDDAVLCTQSGDAMTGNATTTCQGGSFVVRATGGSVIAISTTYASNPANGMVYSLTAALEQL